METLEIQAKSFLIKWVTVPDLSTVIWQVKPLKKSINFGFFCRPGGPLNEDDEIDLSGATVPPRRASTASLHDPIEARLKKSGLECVDWHGKCLPGHLLRGSYDISHTKGGTYALVFDNTFSKNTSKTVHFSQRVVPTSPHEKQTKHSRALSTTGTLASQSSSLVHSAAVDVNAAAATATAVVPGSSKEVTSARVLPSCTSDGRHLSGMMLKKRRKRLQGYARRYFSLDYKYGVLSYYESQNSSILRGSMPIKLCVVSARAKTRDIYIDSGMELWNIKPFNTTDFTTWVAALDVARLGASTLPQNTKSFTNYLQHSSSNNLVANRLSLLLDPNFTPHIETALVTPGGMARRQVKSQLTGEATQWDKLEVLLKKLEKSAEKARDASERYDRSEPYEKAEATAAAAAAGENMLGVVDGNQGTGRRPSFWKRRSRQSSSTQLAAGSGTTIDIGPTDMHSRRFDGAADDDVSAELSTKLGAKLGATSFTASAVFGKISAELLELVEEFKSTIEEGKPVEEINTRRSSLDTGSIFSEELEFFDAQDAQDNEGVLYIESDESSVDSSDDVGEYESASDIEEDFVGSMANLPTLSRNMEDTLKKTRSHDHAGDLYPLTDIKENPVRRNIIPLAKATPPNFLTIIRKNVGKDMSSVAMPVTANEPLTILQRFTEVFESISLISKGLTYPEGSAERILHIAAFGAVFIASSRAKERANRKPFTPLLGETFEFVHSEQKVRIVSEKVSHRPPIMAMQAEAAEWTLQHSPSPHQQIWGKSIEINNRGTVRLSIISTGEVYEWVQPTTFMRNIIAGVKYIEPVGNLAVVCSNGWRSVVEYKAGGLFSGRSEELRGKAIKPDGKELPGYSIDGKWTSSIEMTTPATGGGPAAATTTIWKVGPLVDKYAKRFGYTQYSANLNEITVIEKGFMAPTDSRLRPDQRMYENGDVDGAEAKKLELEQKQRERRNTIGEEEPVFFEREIKGGGGGPKDSSTGQQQQQNHHHESAEHDELWCLKKGSQNYWERRKRGDWAGLTDIFLMNQE